MKILRLFNQAARQAACRAILEAPEGWIMKLSEPTRTLEQNALLHPLCRKIQRHLEANGAGPHDEDWWRYWLVANYAGQEVVPGRDGQPIVVSKIPGTSDMTKAQASEFVEWLYSYGIEIGVRWQAEREAA